MGSRERSKNCVDFPSPFDPKELKMASGVAVSEDVKIKYDEIKKKKTHRYCVFFIKDEKLIAVEKIGGRDSSYEEFLSDIMACGPEDCRYGLYDFEYEHQCQGTSRKRCSTHPVLMPSKNAWSESKNIFRQLMSQKR